MADLGCMQHLATLLLAILIMQLVGSVGVDGASSTDYPLTWYPCELQGGEREFIDRIDHLVSERSPPDGILEQLERDDKYISDRSLALLLYTLMGLKPSGRQKVCEPASAAELEGHFEKMQIGTPPTQKTSNPKEQSMEDGNCQDVVADDYLENSDNEELDEFRLPEGVIYKVCGDHDGALDMELPLVESPSGYFIRRCPSGLVLSGAFPEVGQEELELRPFRGVCQKHVGKFGGEVGWKGFSWFSLSLSFAAESSVELFRILIEALPRDLVEEWRKLPSAKHHDNALVDWSIKIFDKIRYVTNASLFQRLFSIMIEAFPFMIDFKGPPFASFVGRKSDQALQKEKKSFAFYYIRVAILQFLLDPSSQEAREQCGKLLAESLKDSITLQNTVTALNFFFQVAKVPESQHRQLVSTSAMEIMSILQQSMKWNLFILIDLCLDLHAQTVLEVLARAKVLSATHDSLVKSLWEKALTKPNGNLAAIIAFAWPDLIQGFKEKLPENISVEALMVVQMLHNQELETFLLKDIQPCDKVSHQIPIALPALMFRKWGCLTQSNLAQFAEACFSGLFGIPYGHIGWEERFRTTTGPSQVVKAMQEQLVQFCGSAGTEVIFTEVKSKDPLPKDLDIIPMDCKRPRAYSLSCKD